MHQASAVVIGQPPLQIGECLVVLTGLVERVRPDMGCHRVPGKLLERAFDELSAPFPLPQFHQGKCKRAQVPPVIAVRIGEWLQERELLWLPVDPAAETDESEHAARRAQGECVSGVGLNVLAGQFQSSWNLSGAQAVKDLDVLSFAGGRAFGQRDGVFDGASGLLRSA